VVIAPPPPPNPPPRQHLPNFPFQSNAPPPLGPRHFSLSCCSPSYALCYFLFLFPPIRDMLWCRVWVSFFVFGSPRPPPRLCGLYSSCHFFFFALRAHVVFFCRFFPLVRFCPNNRFSFFFWFFFFFVHMALSGLGATPPPIRRGRFFGFVLCLAHFPPPLASYVPVHVVFYQKFFLYLHVECVCLSHVRCPFCFVFFFPLVFV